jgi:chromosome segregation ATPase
MKLLKSFHFLFLAFLVFAALAVCVVGQEEKEGEAEQVAVDCAVDCAEPIAALEAEKATLQQQLNELTRQKDQLYSEWKTATDALAATEAAAQEARTLLDASSNASAELETMKKTLEQAQEDVAFFQKVAQDNQKYMQEYKNQLHTQRDTAHKLSEALKEANLKIEELESMTFIKQLQKEITVAWSAIVEYWINLKNKGKSSADAEF